MTNKLIKNIEYPNRTYQFNQFPSTILQFWLHPKIHRRSHGRHTPWNDNSWKAKDAGIDVEDHHFDEDVVNDDTGAGHYQNNDEEHDVHHGNEGAEEQDWENMN